jgi:ArsR family transcriptional regulator, arsenate/arsenite/antimonite-responsive transcriptional repressor
MKPTATKSSDLAGQFHALSDETRVRIVDLLREGELCVCEVTEALELSQSLLSFHLKVLREAGLVRDRREGRWVYYALDPESMAVMGGFLRKLDRAHRRGKNPRCCDDRS